jgi:hypothetical protein
VRRRLSIAVWWVAACVVDGATAAWSWLRGRTLLTRYAVAMTLFVGMATTALVCGPSWLYWGLFAGVAVAVVWALKGFKADERQDTGTGVDR